MTDTLDVLTDKQKAKIRTLARQGCSINEVGTALGFTQGTIAQILEDENHPFNTTYWQAKVRYARQLRDLAMNLAKTSEDDAVRAKVLEFLTKENSEAFENKRLHSGYTNIRKLVGLVRQQFDNSPDGRRTKKVNRRSAACIPKE